MFGDGREERMSALLLELNLMSDPKVVARKRDYNARVGAALSRAKGMSKNDLVNALIASNPAYIRDLLETEDARFGAGSLAERYARTFWRDEPTTIQQKEL